MSARERMRLWRERLKKGLAPYRVVAPDVDTPEYLVSVGLLSPGDVEDKKKVEAALSELIVKTVTL